MHDNYSMWLPLRVRSTRPTPSTAAADPHRLMPAAVLLTVLTVAGCDNTKSDPNTKPEALDTYDTVTLSASSCQSGCANPPTITAKSSSCDTTNNSCAANCTIQASTNTVTFEFDNANGVKFASDTSCDTIINSSQTGSSYTYYVKWKDTKGAWQCSDPTITVQSGVCTGPSDD